MRDKEILDKIRQILNNESMSDSAKVANIHYVITRDSRYYIKPWYMK